MFILDLFPSIIASLAIHISIRESTQHENPLAVACIIFMFAGFFAFLIYLFQIGHKNLHHTKSVLIYGCIAGLMMYVSVWNFGRLLQRYEFSLVNIAFTTIVLISTFVIGTTLYHESITFWKLMGIVLVIAGLTMFYTVK